MKDGFLIKRYKGPHNNAVNDVSMYLCEMRNNCKDQPITNHSSLAEKNEIYFYGILLVREF